jgi:peptidoglycan hydrolase-like protein with peptidoglycan-binding domain
MPGEAPTASLVTRAESPQQARLRCRTAQRPAHDQTRNAIKSFERRNGLEETGEVNIPLVTKLERLTS